MANVFQRQRLSAVRVDKRRRRFQSGVRRRLRLAAAAQRELQGAEILHQGDLFFQRAALRVRQQRVQLVQPVEQRRIAAERPAEGDKAVAVAAHHFLLQRAEPGEIEIEHDV